MMGFILFLYLLIVLLFLGPICLRMAGIDISKSKYVKNFKSIIKQKLAIEED